jgi:hypothetical protein
MPGTIRVGAKSNDAQRVGAASVVGAQTLIYFGAAGGALALALTLLYARYVRRDPQAVRSRGGFAFFAACMLLFALGAAAAGFVAWRAGR